MGAKSRKKVNHLEVSRIIFIFAIDKRKRIMKESKPYPVIGEEDDSLLMASEPVGAANVDPYAPLAYQSIPGLPETWDELLDGINEGEEELERGEFIQWDIATKDMRMHPNKIMKIVKG